MILNGSNPPDTLEMRRFQLRPSASESAPLVITPRTVLLLPVNGVPAAGTSHTQVRQINRTPKEVKI